MPTYEYKCTKCSYSFDKFQGMNDKPLQRCPKCRSKVKRLLGTGAGIIFKGSGFYETDYRRKRSGGEEKAAKPASSSASDTKSKPASTKKG